MSWTNYAFEAALIIAYGAMTYRMGKSKGWEEAHHAFLSKDH